MNRLLGAAAVESWRRALEDAMEQFGGEELHSAPAFDPKGLRGDIGIRQGYQALSI